MRKVISSLTIFILLLTSCKSDKNNETQQSGPIEVIVDSTNKAEATYEDKLLDFRPISKRFNEDFLVNDFGVDKINDSIYKLVLKLDPMTLNETVLKYSIGVRGVNNTTHNNSLLGAYAPEVETIDEGKYIRLRAVLPKTEYFDSLNFYIYERKNWQGAGMLGGFWIRDILLVEE